MKAFKIVVDAGDPPFPEGAVVLKRDGQYLMITPKSGGYTVEEFSGEHDQAIRESPRFEEVEVPDSLWDVVLKYRDAQEGDSKRGEEKAIEDLRETLGPELMVFVHVGGVT
ncbi:MAG: hypothetical protein HYW91_02150 [Candidatus Sungbacteria bacterium]|nr:hypothetical protein [Candidatus Sungbacteria bacterium]